MSLDDWVKQRIAAAITARRTGKPAPPPDYTGTGIEFREITATAAVLRNACQECTTCLLPVLRDSMPAHAQWHADLALRISGEGPTPGTFVAPGPFPPGE